MTEANERRKDNGTRDRIDDIHNSYIKLSHRVLAALLISSTVFIVCLVIDFFLIRDNDARVKDIQQERTSTIIRNCKDQNQRHIQTIRELQREHFPPKAESATVLLIDTLAPYTSNCAALAASATKGN